MTIRQQGGVFGRNPKFSDVEVDQLQSSGDISSSSDVIAAGGNIKLSGTSFGSVLNSLNDGFAFGTSGGKPVLYPINNGSSVTNQGSVGTASNTLEYGYFGSGVFLGGTVAANLLDDYEEGSFSSDTDLTSNYTFVSKFGRYTKVGDMVTAWFRYEWTSANLGSGDTTFGALPFAATENGYVHITECNANIAADQIYGSVLSGTSQFKLYGRSNASTTLFGPAQRSVWQSGGASNIIAGVAVYKS